MKLKVFTALVVFLVPVLAQAKPRTATAHMRPQLFHDRAPKIHTHTHETKVRSAKSPSPPPVKEDF